MRFQPRDGDLLLDIYYLGDGVLTRRHIWQLHWPDAMDEAAVRKRLQKLREEGYITWPTADQYRAGPIPEPVVFLDWRGILWVAGEFGVEVDPPANSGENQLRLLEGRLRKSGIRWRRLPSQPRGGFSKLSHDIAVTDIKLAFRRSAAELPSFSLQDALPESLLRSYNDLVVYKITGTDGVLREDKRGVVPDSILVIANEERRARGQPYTLLLPLEVDMGQHTVRSGASHPDFTQHKVLAYAAYITSPQYKARFGRNSGRWLIVTTGQRRMEHLMQETERVTGKLARLFYFSTLDMLGITEPKGENDQAGHVNVLTSRVWWQVGAGEPVDLVNIR